jgi:putative peptide zinc metalloprotease protein
MQEIPIYPHSLITTVPLETSCSGEEVVIGSSCLNTSFIKSTPIGLQAIELLNQGRSLSETEDVLSNQYRQDVSIKELIKILFEVNLISSIDDKHINVGYKTNEQSTSKWIKIINVFFSRSAYLIYLLLFVTAVVMNAHRLMNFPQLYSSVIQFAVQFPVVTILIAWLLVLKHEWFHYLAALSLAVPAQIKIGSRYIFIVLETQSDAINLIEKGQRYRFYLAGMLWDLLIIVILLHINNLLALLDIKIDARLINLCILQTIAGIIFQFDIFFKTDLYFVLTDYFGKDNLYTNSGILLKSWFSGANFSEDLENDTAVIIFALGRLFNYLFISILLFLSIYLFLAHRRVFEQANMTINWNLQYIYALTYFVLLSLVKIKDRKRSKDYTITFQPGETSGK